MSTISSSKSNGSQRKQQNNNQNIYDDDSESNPFSVPADEKIFSFKEEEKEKKFQNREKNKNMKIWEKNRPTREGCLRQICETDIEPSALAINPKVQKKINSAEASGFTIPIERPKNKENRYKLIDKKREMFLVQQMLETKQREIQRLEDHAFMREDGLNCSEKMLAQDTNSFIAFFNDIKEKTSQAQRELEEYKKKKNSKTIELRQINDEYSILVSSINKNIESLSIFHEYKQFLDQLQPKEYEEEMERRKQQRIKDKEAEQNRQNMKHPTSKSIMTGKSKNVGDKKGSTVQTSKTDIDNDVIIPENLKEFIEESDDEYPLNFEEPDQLLEIFSTLEEKNLFLIQQGQDSEQVLEEKRQEYKDVQERLKKEISVLESSLNEIKDRKQKTKTEKNILQSTTEDEENKVLNPVLYQKIEIQIKELYQLTFGEEAENKMSNANAMNLLNEIEKELNKYIQEFNISEQIDKTNVAQEWKKIKDEQRRKQREEKLELEKKLNQEKQEKRQNEKDRKQFVKVGKAVMTRSQKPEVKKNVQVKKTLTEEEENRKKYLQI